MLDIKKMKILVTGTAGFIGFHLAKKLLEIGNEVVGLDNINDYYDVNLKYARLAETGIARENIQWGKLVCSTKYLKYRFVRLNLGDQELLMKLFAQEKFDIVVNLAAQAGVRYSVDNPMEYINSNIVGFTHILEGCRHNKIKHLVYASSSSVYGANTKMPFSVHQNVNHPLNLYAASKKANELMAHSYSHLFGVPTTGLRFFTVYGPWGRPDMALFKFTKAIETGKPIQVFNAGKHRRDFTYIDDVIDVIIRILNQPSTGDSTWNGNQPDPSTSFAPWRIYNVGNSNPQELIDYISVLERALDKKAIKELLPLQIGDLPNTYADIKSLAERFDYKPETPINVGIIKFIDWYRAYFSVK
jgi:UDP-glucuronate 4-epimerase